MKMTVRGIPGRPVALFIHPALTDYSFFDPLVDALKGRYRIAMPTLDGHYKDAPAFSDAATQAERIEFHLKAEHIDHVEVMLACGIGAGVGLQLLARLPHGTIRRSVFDAAQLGKSATGEALYLRHIRKIAKASLANPSRARNHVDTRDERYARLVVETARIASQQTLKNVAHAAYAAQLPQIPAGAQGFMTFVWGTYDQAGEAGGRVLKAYPHADIHMVEKIVAYGYLLGDPDGFAAEFLA